MTEEEKKLLSTFEFKLRQLMHSHQELKNENARLKQLNNEKQDQIIKMQSNYDELKTIYTNLKQARIISINDSEIKDTKLRLSRLVREVDKCIALLNE